MDDARNHFRIRIRPSRILGPALGLAYAGAAASLLSLDLGPGIKILMLAFLLLSVYCDLRVNEGGRGKRRVREILLDPEGDWRVIRGSGEILRGRPSAGRLVHPLAVCFTLELSNGTKLPVYILHDMCDSDAFCRLRAWLRAYGESAARRLSYWPALDGGKALRP